MFFVYILEAQESKRFYNGQTNNLVQRIKRHIQGRNLSTRAFIPWSLKWWKEYQTRTEAVRVEKTLKGIKKRTGLEKFVRENGFSGCGHAMRDKLRWLAHHAGRESRLFEMKK